MPTIAVFYGITVYFNLTSKEHNPPHVHAEYGGYSATFKIKEKEVLAGKLPPRATNMVVEFITQYEQELLEMWETEKYRKLEGIE